MTKAGPEIIKRYANRKLYDPAGKRHVTLEDLALRVGKGEEIVVQDQASGEDITNLVLAQVVLETVKDRTASIPRQVLTRLVRLTANPAPPSPAPTIAARARDEAERIVTGLLSRQKLSLEEALQLRSEIARSVQGAVADAQRTLEQTLHALVERTEKEAGVNPSLAALKERLLTLDTYLAAPGAPPAARPKTKKTTNKRSR